MTLTEAIAKYEQMRKNAKDELNDCDFQDYDIRIDCEDTILWTEKIIKDLKTIQNNLPSDQEIEQELQKIDIKPKGDTVKYGFEKGWMQCAKWMRNKLIK